MIYFIILVAIVARTLSAGLKRYERRRRFSSWRMWLASILSLSICYVASHADLIGVPLSWLDSLFEGRLGVIVLSLCFFAVYFGIQFLVNQTILRDWNGAQLAAGVNTRLCARAIVSLLAIPLALVAFHTLVHFLILAA